MTESIPKWGAQSEKGNKNSNKMSKLRVFVSKKRREEEKNCGFGGSQFFPSPSPSTFGSDHDPAIRETREVSASFVWGPCAHVYRVSGKERFPSEIESQPILLVCHF